MLNSLRDGQINYGTTNCSAVHIPPHNVVAPIHQNSHISTEPATSVYPWNSNPRLEHLYGFHSRYYNLDFPTPYPSATNQYVPTNMYGQNMPQCCQPCCRLRSQSIPKASPSQVLYNPIRPVQQLNRSYKSKKTLKTPCSEQFLPYIPNDFPVKYDTQNCYQQKYNSSYLNNTNYCPPANNLWIPPAANTTWPTDRLQPLGRHTSVQSHDFSRDKNYQRLPNYQNNPYSNPIGNRPYNYIPTIPTDVHDYRSSVYHNTLKSNTSEYISHGHSSRIPISSQNSQSPSSLQQYYNAQSVLYPNLQRHNDSLKPPQATSQNSLKSNLNVREFLATWDEEEEEVSEKSSEVPTPIVVLDCMTLEGDALTKIQEKLNVVSYENLEKVLKENQNSLIINTESNENDSIHNKAKPPSKSNFEPLDYTKRETGIIKPFVTEKKTSPETTGQAEKSYSVNFDGMVAWYGKKNTDISSTDLIEKLADRIFNLSKSQENEGVSFGTAAYTGQITQTNRAIANSVKDSSKYIQSQQLFGLQHHTEKYIEPSVINKTSCNNDIIPRTYPSVSNESDKASLDTKSNNVNSSCIVENITKKYLNVTNEQTTPWNLEHNAQEQNLNLSLYDHSINKPLDFSSLTDETKCNPFAFEKNSSSDDKPNNGIDDQFNKGLNENNNYNTTVSNDQHLIQQIDSSNRNFPVIVSPHNHRQDYSEFHESVIQRTGCDKNKHEKMLTQSDFDSMNWNISNDFEKIIKNSNMSMESSCLYDRNNYNILDGMNVNKNVSNQWKNNNNNNIPCIDLTVSSKTNSSHDTFFDGWNFIENYDNHSIKKIVHSSPNNNEVNNPSFINQINSLDKINIKNNNSDQKVESELLGTVKDVSFSKTNIMTSANMRSRDVFNLNNRIPDFSDGFELPPITIQHDYMQFKKSSNDSENRTDGSIFEQLTEPKFIKTIIETSNGKTDVHKPDIVGLPSFKEKEPLAPMPVPLKLNIVKPIIRDPSKIHTVIKQKLKYDNACANNNNVVSHKIGNSLRDNETNTFNVTDLKSKYNDVQLNQFDVWSEKFVLKGNSNNSSTAVVQCDVEITQFKSTPENRNTLVSKSNSDNYQDKNIKLTENIDCNLTMNKINVIENDKINSNEFLNCLESTKTNDQKYRDTLDEFETSFGFDIHCSNESNKSFHEDIVDKCLEERIKDQIGEHNMNTSNTTSSNNTQLPFQCDFQSSFPIKNYFDENKNKAVVLDQIQTRHLENSDTTTVFNFDLHNNHNIHITQNSKNNPDFNILNDTNHNVEKIQNVIKGNNSNFTNKTELKHSFVSNDDNIDKMSDIKKNDFDYFTMGDRNFEFENNKKCIQESTDSKNINDINNLSETNNVCKISHSNFSNSQKNASNDFELDINDIHMFESNSNTKSKIGINDDLEHEKNSFIPIFHSENAENTEQHNKNIFELENNNSDLHNLEKIDDFDFHTRSIQSFEMDCSHNNVHELTSTEKIFTNDNQIKNNYNYDINNKENKETKLKNTLSFHKVSQSEDITALEANSISENKIVLKADSIAKNNREKQIPKTNINTEFGFLNDNNEEININNCHTHTNSNANINEEVENIFEHLYDNLNTLNTEKDNSNNSCQNDVSNSIRNIEDQNLKIDNIVINQNHRRTQIDECYKPDKISEKPNNVLKLEEFVNNSVSHLSTFSLQQNESFLEQNSLNITPGDTRESDKYISNKNENILNISNKTLLCENTTMFKEQNGKSIKQVHIESINQNDMQHINNKIVNTVQGETTAKQIENIKSDLFNTIISTNKTQDEEDIQNNSLKLGSIIYDKLAYQQSYNEMVAVKDLSTSEYSSEKCVDVPKSILDSINHNKLTYCQHFSDVIEVKDSPKSECGSVNHVELTLKNNSNDPIEVEDSLKITNLINHGEIIHEQNLSQVETPHKLENSLLNNDELIVQKHSNETIEVEESSKFEINLINHHEIIHKQHSNEISHVEDLSKFEISLMDHIEITHKQNSSHVEVSHKLETISLNNDKLTEQKHLNETIEVEESSKFEFNLINHREIIHKQLSNEIIHIEDYPKFKTILINHDKLTHEQHSNKTFKIEDSPKFETNLINHGDKIHKQYFNKNIEVEDSPIFENNLIHHGEIIHKEHSNAIFEDSPIFETNLMNNDKLTHKQHSNKTFEVEDSTKFETNSIVHSKIMNKQNSSEVETSHKLETSSLNNGKLIDQKQYSNETDEVQYPAKSKYCHLKDIEFSCQQNSKKMIEAEDLSKYRYNSLNRIEHVKDKLCEQKFDDVNHDEDFTISKPDSPNVLLTDHQSFDENEKDSTNIKMLELPKFNVNKSDDDLIDTYSKGVEEIKLTRVKFTFKCNNKNMIKTNIFDRDPIMPLKKRSVLENKHFIVQNNLKIRNSVYKPWRNIFYEKPSIDNLKENVRNDNEVECSVKNTELLNIPQHIKLSDYDNKKKKDEKITSLSELTFSNEDQCNEQAKKVVDGEMYTSNSTFAMNDDPYELFVCNEYTPMPSPCNDFESDSQSSEHFGEEFWDKSLENEYKNVLRKTISKLPKNRISIRDRFNTRLLAHKVNTFKRKNRQQLGSRRFVTTTTEPQTPNEFATIEAIKFPNTTVIPRLYPTRCKIKVQLPWGRIFNLNDQSRMEDTCQEHAKDTKIELGPARVEIRLSQTPGEWQVAACRSVTSSKSVVSVKRLVLQRAANVYDECCSVTDHSGVGSSNVGDGMLRKCSRKLPKIVIRRNGQDNNYTTSYVSSSGFDEGGDNLCESPRLMVRLVRDKNLDAMAAGGVTTLHLKHLVPTSTESVADTRDAKRVRYA